MIFISNLTKRNIKRPVGSYHRFQIMIISMHCIEENFGSECFFQGKFKASCDHRMRMLCYDKFLFFYYES